MGFFEVGVHPEFRPIDVVLLVRNRCHHNLSVPWLYSQVMPIICKTSPDAFPNLISRTNQRSLEFQVVTDVRLGLQPFGIAAEARIVSQIHNCKFVRLHPTASLLRLSRQLAAVTAFLLFSGFQST